jgi:hypothetical protein
MACYSYKIKHFPFPKPLILFYLLLIVTDFFSPLRPFTSAIQFNFPSFNACNTDVSELRCDRAYPANQVIPLTGTQFQKVDVGRATYVSPIHLWDKASGNLTDFTTHFSFVIDSQNKTNYADGLAFFLAPNGLTIPEDSSGGALGLASRDQVLNSSYNPFVAVEFDIFFNPDVDPPGVHVGIDINSIISVANVSWLGANISIFEGRTNEARISYNSTSYDLSVLFTGLVNNTTVWQSFSYNIDLRDHLPEWVTIGFSATTGLFFAMHTIHTWNFTSTLEDTNVTKPTVVESPIPRLNPAPNPRKNNRLGLAIGLGVGGSLLVGGFALILFCLWKRKKSYTAEDLAFDRCMDDEFQRGTGPKRFSFKELAHATNNFNDEEKLGQGGFGGVYRGFLQDLNSFVAIKRVSKGSKQGIKEYASEVKIISRLRHRNLVKLIGW